MFTPDPNTLLVMAAVFVANASQVVKGTRATWEFVRGLPTRDLERAEAIVAQHEEDEAIRDLARERAALVSLAAIAPALEVLPHQVAEVLKEVKPNGGGSMRDDITSIKSRLEAGDGRFDAIEGRVSAIEQQRKSW